jgi:hypothetical protein
MVAVKHMLRYVQGTLNMGCIYKGGGDAKLTDSDHAGDLDTRASPVNWNSLNYNIVTLSSCDDEYAAATTATCQRIWLAKLLHTYVITSRQPVQLHG